MIIEAIIAFLSVVIIIIVGLLWYGLVNWYLEDYYWYTQRKNKHLQTKGG